MQLKDYIQKCCVSPCRMANKLNTYPKAIYRIIHEGVIPSLSVAIKIEDFTEGRVTCRDIFNECIALKEIKNQRNEKRKKKNSPQTD